MRTWSKAIDERRSLLNAMRVADTESREQMRARVAVLDVEIAKMRREYDGEGEEDANEDSYSRGGRYEEVA